MNSPVNRCLGYTIHKKKCRTRIYDGRLFCCYAHQPLNPEIEKDGCNLCIEAIHDTRDLYYFPCKHAFHKSCYNDWCKVSTYLNPICIICRKDTPFFLVIPRKKKSRNVIHATFCMENIHDISFILNK